MQKFKVKKISSGKKALISAVLIISLFFSPFTAPKADAWLSIPAAIIGELLDDLLGMIMAIITSLLKTVGTTAINKLTVKMLSSGDSGPMFITDWKDYLVGGAQKESQKYMNDYISQFARGMGSSSGYKPAPGFEGIGQNAFNQGTGQYANYSTRVVEMMKADVVAPAMPRMTFEANPSRVYEKGNFKQDSLLRSGVNTPMAAKVLAWSEAAGVKDQGQIVNQTKAIAGQGFIGKEKNGMTMTPGSAVKDVLSNVLNIGNTSLATAKSIPEVLTALATKLISDVINQGIGQISVKIDKQVNGVLNKSGLTVKARVQNNGPGVLYKK